MQKKNWRRATLGVAVGTLLAASTLAACGADDRIESGSTAPAAAGETSTGAQSAGLTGPAIKIGLICGCTGPLASSLGAIPDLVRAWEQATNDAGGVNGHPVEVILKDDQANPSKAATAARELVNERAVAAVGNFSTTSTVYSPQLAEGRIPQIGGSSSDLRTEVGTNFFPSGGNVAGRDYGIVKSAKDAGKQRMAVFYCAEFPSCAARGELMAAIAEIIGGIEIVTEGSMSATSPNYIPQCLKIKQSGADSMYISNGPPPIIKLLNDCLQQGVRIPAFEQAVATPEMAEQEAAQGMKVMYGNPPASDTSTPGGRYLNDSIDRYAPGLRETTNWNENLTAVWSGLELFKTVGRLGELTPDSTTADVYDALYEVRDETLEGLSPPLTFERGRGAHVGCWFEASVQDRRIVSDGSEAACIPQDQVEAIEAASGLD